MCGINGVIGRYALRKAIDIAIAQEHRGQSSTGIAYIYNNNIGIVKDTLTPREFKAKYNWLLEYNVKIAIAHNRAPSVGAINYYNSHPFISCNYQFALIHNGTAIFGRDHDKVAKILKVNGHRIYGSTDSELLTHILETYVSYYKSYVIALEQFSKEWLGGAIIILTKDKKIFGVRGNHNPLVVAKGKNGDIYLASELQAIKKVNSDLEYAYTPLKNTVVEVTKNDVVFYGDFEEAKEESERIYYYINRYLDYYDETIDYMVRKHRNKKNRKHNRRWFK